MNTSAAKASTNTGRENVNCSGTKNCRGSRAFCLLLILSSLLIAIGLSCRAAPKTPQIVRRVPLEKSKVSPESPTSYATRTRLDPRTGKLTDYDPKPRIEIVDVKTGKYEIKWIGYDGREKLIAYQRADAVDVIVSASADKSADGNYLYTYTVENLPTSPTYLSYFLVQDFSTDTKPVELNGKATNLADLRLIRNFRQVPSDGKPKNIREVLIGEMSSQIPQFKEGNWMAFAILPEFEPAILPGRRLEVMLVSSAPPGLVGSSATGGDRTLKGVGEDMPSELELAIPGYDEWLRGYTIGPVSELKSLSPTAHLKYILDNLPKFERLGWITPAARKKYEKIIPSNDLDTILKQADLDIQSEQITSEVFAIVQAVKK
jgi:hypothetical protein